MTGWTELKDAFWAVVDSDPAERARQIAALASIDPELARRLEALLQADDRGESLQHIFETEPVQAPHPTRIGNYDVTGVLGFGGMGDVYRARDARLQREVAIKVLPPAVTTNPERLVRFEREAQLLASLNHPHIAQVYGLDDSGDAPALVMELVTGPTLATVIADRATAPLTIGRALTIARQIADGLDAAHEKGIVHRDLKPGNVALTQEGDVKILDFGLAKPLDAGVLKTPGGSRATEAGVVLGTPAYMSPEQARGLSVDKRADVWAFGCLVYELLTGRPAFGGDTPSDILAAVLERDADMAILPAETPPGVRSLLRHCLEKDPRRRLRDIADARLAIDDALNPSAVERSGRESLDGGSTRAVRIRVWLWLLAGLGIAASVVILVNALQPSRPADQARRTVASIVLPRGIRLGGADLVAESDETRFAVSPDGRKLALVAADESGRTQLWLRDLGTAAFQPLAQTDDASFPFWSPDSESIGFVAAGKLKTVRLSDGTATTVSDSAFRLGDWSRNNLILFAPARSSPLHAVPASGGAPTPVTTLDAASGEVQHGYPAFLPGGRYFLYFSIGTLTGGALDPRGIYLGSLDAAEPARLLLPGTSQARYANGHILFVQNGTLMAQPFELESRELRGAPVPLVEEMKLSTAGASGATAAFSVSDNGVLVYQAALRTESRPVWFDRSGRQLGALGSPTDYSEVSLSPDGSRLVVSAIDPARATRDLWLYDVASGRGQRLTFDTGDEFAPVWSPDGTRLLFSSLSKGLINLKIKDVRTTADPTPIEVDKLGLGRFASDWSRDGRYIMYVGGGRAIARSDLWVAPVSRTEDARAFLDSTFIETHGRFAPREPWLAYASNETGQLEVYVDRFPDLGAKRLVSTRGGRWPRWASDGRELFYISPENQLMAVAITATPDRLDIGVPRPLFAVRPRPPVRLDAYPYDVSPDGQRFVVNALMEDTASTAITLTLNWADGIDR
jgi:eukaryotic-like serine/threonine-protein kinase